MMSKTADARFQLEKQIETRLCELSPLFHSRYALITHSLLPYKLCKAAGIVQQEILSQLSDGITSVEQVDIEKASKLLAAHWEPFLQTHNITQEQCHYTSKYY
jgi:kynurenine 3-monooxygenase